MSTPSEEIIVRVTAQLAELEAGMEQAVTVVQGANARMIEGGKSADEEMAASAKSTSEAVSTAFQESAASVTASNAEMGASAEAASERIRAMVKASLEQAGANGVLAESERSLAERQGLRVELTTQERRAILAAAEADRQRVAAEIDAISAKNADTEAQTANTIATDANTEAQVMNSRASAEVGTIVSEALAGNFGRIRRSTAALANQTGILTKVLGFLMSPLGAVTVGVGVLAAAAIHGADEEQKLNAALLTTGNYAATSAGTLNEMASNMTSATVSIGRAREAVAALASTGSFTEAQIGDLAQAVLAAGDLMGQSAQETVHQFTEIQNDPVRAIEKLNERMHFLTTSVMQQIVQLNAQGDSMGAARIAMNAYGDALTTRAREADAQLGTLQRGWDSVKNSASFAWDAMLGIGRPMSRLDELGQKIISINQDIAAAREKMNTGHTGFWAEITGHGAGGRTKEQLQTYIAQLEAERTKLMQSFSAKNGAAQAAAAAKHIQKSIQDAGAAGAVELQKLGINMDGLATKTDKVKEAARALFQIYEAGGKLPKGVHFGGPIVDMPEGSGWEKIKAHLLSGRHHGGHKNNDKLPTLDPYAKQQMEQEYQAMQKAAQQASQIQNIEQQAFMHHEQAKTAIAEQQIQARLQLGQISASEAITLEERLQQSIYQKDLAYYRRQLALLRNKPVEMAKINAQIEALEDRHQQRMQHLQDRAQKENIKRWERFLQPVSQAINGSVQGIIQGTQTAGQAIRNFERNMLATFIKTEMDKLIHYTAIQLGILTVKQSTDEARTASHIAAAATSKAIDAKTGKSQITSAAATGAAKAYQAMAGIPVIGPVLGAIAAAATFVGIEKYGGQLASAQGGWERVPADGMVTELHKDEQVLPAAYAEGLRRLVAQGGTGTTNHNTTHVHIHAVDARSFRDWARRNPGELANWAHHAKKNGF